MKIQTRVLCGIVFILLAAGCKKAVKENLDVPPASSSEVDLKSENGYLVFKDYQTLYSLINEINILKDDPVKFAAWENNLGFHSLFSFRQNANVELDAVLNVNDQNRVIEKYRDELFYSALADNFELRNGQQYISPVLNEKGIVKVGKVLMRFKEGATISTPTDYSALLKTDNLEELEKNKDIKIHGRQLPGNASARYDINPYQYNNTTTRVHFGEVFQEGDRKIICELKEDWTTYPQYDNNNEFTRLSFMWRVYLKFSHQKKGLFGWNNNASSTYIVNIDYTMKGKLYPIFENSIIIGGQVYYASDRSGVSSVTFSNHHPNTIIYPKQQEIYWYLSNSADNSRVWYVSGAFGSANFGYTPAMIQAFRDYWQAHGYPAESYYCPAPETEFSQFYIDVIGDGFPSGNRLMKSYSYDVPYL